MDSVIPRNSRPYWSLSDSIRKGMDQVKLTGSILLRHQLGRSGVVRESAAHAQNHFVQFAPKKQPRV
jgi:hypothetical protein